MWIKYDVNSIVSRVFNAKDSTLKSPVVKINKQDVAEIKKRFDNKKVRFTALTFLCYAKAYADKNGEFRLSSVGLSAWLGINRKTLRNRYIKELIDFDYLIKVERHKNNPKWSMAYNSKIDQPYDSQATKYKLNVVLHNSGDHILINNNIWILFSELF